MKEKIGIGRKIIIYFCFAMTIWVFVGFNNKIIAEINVNDIKIENDYIDFIENPDNGQRVRANNLFIFIVNYRIMKADVLLRKETFMKLSFQGNEKMWRQFLNILKTEAYHLFDDGVNKISYYWF